MGIESEKDLDKKLRIQIKKMGGLYLKLDTTHMVGLPDRLCLLPGGRLSFIEIKTTGKKPRRIQLIVHSVLEKLGYDVRVIDSSEGINKYVKDNE